MTKRFQFSVAALLLVVTVAAGACAAGSFVFHELRLASARASMIVKMKQVCIASSAPNFQNFGHPNIFAITGPGTSFDPQLSRGGRYRMKYDLDTHDTILFVEVRNSKTHWMQHGDFDIRTMPHTINDPAGEGISGTCPDCFCVGFADDEAWMLRNDTPFDQLAMFFTIDGARMHVREVELAPYRVKQR